MRSKKLSPHGGRKTKEPVNEHGLTALQEQFCHAYLIRFNIAQAERMLGLKKKEGSRFMQLTIVRDRIHQLRLETGKAFDITRERLLQELMNIVYADTRKLKLEDDVVKWPDEEIAAISTIEYDILGQVSTIKRWDKLKAIELLNKMLGYNMPELTKNLNVNTNPIDPKEAIEIAKALKSII